MDKKTQQLLDRTFYFGVKTLKFLNKLPEGRFYKVPQLQLARSSTSVGANYEEAQGAQTPKDFYHKVAISYKEARESHYWLRVLKELHEEPAYQKEFNTFITEAQELKNIFTAITLSAKGNSKK